MPRGIENQPIFRVEWRPQGELVANGYNPNHVAPLERRLLTRSLVETGWTAPIVVGPDERTIVDGFHRWALAGEGPVGSLTDGAVPIVVCRDMTDAHRVAATIRHNRARGEHGIRPMGSIVRGLLEAGVSPEEIMLELGMELEEVERLADLRSNPARFATEGFSGAWTPE